MSANLDQLLFYPAAFASAAIAVAAVCKSDEKPSTRLWAASLVFGALFFARNLLYAPRSVDFWGIDFRIFWEAGRSLWEGTNPYTTIRGTRPPNDLESIYYYPPQSIPFFALFSAGSQRPSTYLWTIFNAILSLSIGLLARRALIVQDGERYPIVGPAMAALLSAPVLLSRATAFNFDCSQCAMFTTVAILATLVAQGFNPPRPLSAGMALTLASIKIGTTAPFYMLFCRKSDLRMWIWFALLSSLLILISGDPRSLPERITTMSATFKKLSQPGYMNDYSILNWGSNSILALEIPLSRIGIVDRAVAGAIAKAIIVGLGLAIFYVVVATDVDRGAAFSLVSLYTMLFIYHRVYDLPILILPLVYAASRYRSVQGPSRWCYLWIMIAVLLAMNVPLGLIQRVDRFPADRALLRALIVPLPMYLIVSALIAQSIAARIDRNRITAAETVGLPAMA